jgi:hypothetical protein
MGNCRLKIARRPIQFMCGPIYPARAPVGILARRILIALDVAD